MSLCRMRLGGRWEKQGTDWVSLTGKEEEVWEVLDLEPRLKIERLARKRYTGHRRKQIGGVQPNKYHSHKTLKEELRSVEHTKLF